jgi:tartrate-resistant acid phosphatase type 5
MRLTAPLLAILVVSCTSSKPPKDDVVVGPEGRTIEISGQDVVVIGDQGTGEDQQYNVASSIAKYCAVKKCDFAVSVGDNFYPKGVKSITDSRWNALFEHPYKGLAMTFYPALGNHDYNGNWQAEIQYRSPRWQMPARYYQVTSGLADFFALDTLHLDSAQLSWLETALKQSNATWKVIYSHMPIHTSGWHGATVGLKGKLVPLMKKYKVDMYLAGHDHHLEYWGTEDGIIYAISGAGGKMRALKPLTNPEFGKATAGFMHLDFEPKSVKMTFVDDQAQIIFAKVFSK